MSTIDSAVSPSDLRVLAEQSNAWPFEQAKQLVARLKKKPKDEVLFETGYGASCVSGAHRGQGQDPADRFLGRHGRPAQGAGQRAEQGNAGTAPRQAADP